MTAAIYVQHLHFAYPGGRAALSDVCFEISEGERVGLVGPSGAGKSTLLLHLNGLLPADIPPRAANGHAPVTVFGLPVIRENLAEVRRKVGFVFQDPDDQLFCPTVREDVAFGPVNLGLDETEIEKRVERSLAAVSLGGFESRSTMQLSVGEKKRVCLAGVFACEPDMLLLDEPTSNLDPRARKRLRSILQAFPGSQFIATHDLDFVVAHCTRVMVIDDGRIHADGPPAEILTRTALMEQHGLEVPLSLRNG